MSCRLAPVGALVLLTLAGPSVRAQIPFARDLIPSRTSLGRLGLERHWTAVVPLRETERLIRSQPQRRLCSSPRRTRAACTFTTSRPASFSGRPTWASSTPNARPVSSNSFAVFGTSADVLSALDRKTGRVLWRTHLGAIPTCGTVADEDRVIVGTMEGRVQSLQPEGQERQGRGARSATPPAEEWGWQTRRPDPHAPAVAEHVIAFGSSDGRVYVVMKDERTTLYPGPYRRARSATAWGAMARGRLLIPSADNNLYAVDLLTAEESLGLRLGRPDRPGSRWSPARTSTRSTRAATSRSSTRIPATPAGIP